MTPGGRLRIHDGARASLLEREATAETRANRKGSDVYVEGEFEIAVTDRWTYPHTQWLHGRRPE